MCTAAPETHHTVAEACNSALEERDFIAAQHIAGMPHVNQVQRGVVAACDSLQLCAHVYSLRFNCTVACFC